MLVEMKQPKVNIQPEVLHIACNVFVANGF